jgi:hypothetical protein
VATTLVVAGTVVPATPALAADACAAVIDHPSCGARGGSCPRLSP